METRLKKVIAEKGFKHGYVADKAEISKSALSLIVNGKSMPTLPVAIRIARVLNETVESLWGNLVEVKEEEE
ncbi:helix-turn-helix domain-containing protein [Bacillus sp. V3B]|uniref:helix-turn-helix transcriptional regulator n=1 Tax=Bacillus sp. V3B TaxID=2804915 RepID=UPI00210CB748|nr:helix-turn-helix domain-containing protein [Bacillus sp. V3B]MCQ6275739.1 helix-turn-helix domain-containing protein [Bacillus sp. V3B]